MDRLQDRLAELGIATILDNLTRRLETIQAQKPVGFEPTDGGFTLRDVIFDANLP